MNMNIYQVVIYILAILTNVLSGCYSYDILYINFLALGYAHR